MIEKRVKVGDLMLITVVADRIKAGRKIALITQTDHENEVTM